MRISHLKTTVILSLFAIVSVSATKKAPAIGLVQDTTHLAALKQSVEPLVQMTIKEVIAEVPAASGIFFIGCPNCNGGAQEMRVLKWEQDTREQVRCNYCAMVFPNEEFPNNREKVIIAPSGARQVYRYHENSAGREYYFEAHAWYERWQWIQKLAVQLVELWSATHDNAYGDRAAAIVGRFAQLFPDYAVRYDYPNAPVKFFPANQKWPYEGLSPYRGAKWSWWGYRDIPTEMADVYQQLQQKDYDWKRMDSVIGPKTDKRIANDLLRLGYEFTTANPEVYSNMSPGTYRDMVQVGRILKDPAMVHEGVERFLNFLKLGFFADGWWKEGATSYHDQTIRGLNSVAVAAQGYSDPADWKGKRFENLDLTAMIPFYKKALDVSREAILPNGRKIPINDTWAYSRIQEDASEKAVSRLWHALGNAALGAGEGDDQLMLNINWSGNYGHSHYDNGSIILYAAGGEMFSDIGYTHTKYRGWTIETASHNTVVVDQKGQDAGTMAKPVTGRLLHYDDSDARVKTIDVDASPAYAKAKTYRRRLVLVHAGPGRDYIVDRFDVEGGETHDWFLHGMCEEEGTLETSISLNRKLETLVPEWGGKSKPKTQYDVDREGKRLHAYSYLTNVKTGMAAGPWTATWRYEKSGLRTYNLPPAGTEVFRFRSPSIRLAGEDDNKLDDFMHSGIMQRHSGGVSTFMAVHEPFKSDPWIKAVTAEGDELVVRYQLNGSVIEDRITLNDNGVTVSSGAGWQYQSGTPRSGQVEVFEAADGKWRLQLDREAPAVSYIRLDLAGGETRYYPVATVNGKWLELKDDPGFTMDSSGGIKFHTFPHDEYAGPLHYTLFEQVLIKP